jgi:hypothetical protein
MNETATIRGQVIRTSGEPLAKAEVVLSRHELMSQFSYVVTSAADGRFLLDDIEPGQYRLSAARNGFVNETGGEWFGGGVLLTLAPGKQLEGVVIRLAPQAAISGRITDEDGDPVADAPVSLFREMQAPQGRTLIPVGGQIRSTNDLGDFRIPGLLPGRYFLCANWDRHVPHRMGGRIRGGLQDRGPQNAYPPLYFPGTADPVEAAPIDVLSGEDLHGFDMQVKKVQAFRVRGRVELPDGADPRSLHVNLGPHHLAHGWAGGIGGGGGGAMDRPDGAAFDIGGVLPGSYDLMVFCNLAQGQRVTRLAVDVKDRDVEGLVVTFPFGLTIAGVVRSLDDSARLNPTSVFVSLCPKDGMHIGGRPANPSGAFALDGVPPGRYEVAVHVLPESGYVKSVKYQDRDLSDNRIEIGPEGAAGKLEVLMAFDGGEVSGTVEDGSGAPLPSAVVHLLTDPPRFDQQKLARTDQDGRFWFRQIRPGQYWLFALESVEPGISLEQRWEQHEGFARKLTVSAGSHEDLRVRL